MVSLPILALAVASFGIGTTEFVIMGLLPEVAQSFGVTIPQAGYLVSGYAMGVVIGAPLVAIATAGLPRKNLELLRQIQMSCQRRLSAVATAVFEQVDDALFDLADRSGSSGAQQQFFDGMREIRRRRQQVEDKFLSQVEHSFADYVAGRPLAAADAPTAPLQVEGELTLSLVEDAELEAAIALSSMAARACWCEPPRKVSGAEPTRRFFDAARSRRRSPSSRVRTKGFSL